MTNIQPANYSPNSMLRRVPRHWRIIGIIIVASLLAGCADNTATSDDRRFANQQSTEVAPDVTPPVQAPVASPIAPATPASLESLLAVNGAPEVIFTLLNGSIEVVDTTGAGPNRRIVAPDLWRFVGIAHSPVDSQVAVLLMPAGETTTGRPEVVIYDPEGLVVEHWTDLPEARSQLATPSSSVGEVEGAAASITWAPAGDRLLVATGGSDLVRIDVGGDARVIPVPPPVQRVTYAAWSADGEQIALLARNAEGSSAIWVFSPYVDGVSMRQVAPPNADASDLGSVTKFEWLPDGSSLAYIHAGEAGPEARGGQLYTINLKLGIKLLLATPGRGGPAAEIVDFTLSPDGTTIAYTIASPDEDRWRFHSLWVRSVQTPGVYNVPAGNVERVDQLWWVGPGIAWQQQSGDVVDVVVMAAGDVPATVFTIGPEAEGTPGATPPVATPISATPVSATPISATPVLAASPAVATPAPASPAS